MGEGVGLPTISRFFHFVPLLVLHDGEVRQHRFGVRVSGDLRRDDVRFVDGGAWTAHALGRGLGDHLKAAMHGLALY